MYYIVARYNESLDWFKPLEEDNYLIINKGKDDLKFKSILLPNEGRESLSYLYYIINNYHDLPVLNCFLQGNPFGHISITFKDLNRLNELKNTFLGTIHTTDLLGRPDHPGLDLKPFIEELGLTLKPSYQFVAGAQFIITRESILKHPLSFYKKAYDLHFKYKQAPWLIERLWMYIFGN